MLLIEHEAKKRWCPHETAHSGSRSCIASGCMAWRWVDAESMGEKRTGFCGIGFPPLEVTKELGR